MLKLVLRKPKKPNSAIRKVARVMLRETTVKVSMYIPGIGHNLQEYAWVLVRGGRANDLIGVRYTGVKGKLDFSEDEDFERKNKRSKYGLKNPEKYGFDRGK